MTTQPRKYAPGQTVYVDDDGIGDITSNERGSGARFNSDKTPYEYVPVAAFQAAHRREIEGMPLNAVLGRLATFQSGDDRAINQALEACRDWLPASARVFEYGSQKYAAWNWAKGMPWSVPMACILRHAAALIDGEAVDHESGEDHMGHIVCNLIMLHHYVQFYREGDDRPPPELFKESE